MSPQDSLDDASQDLVQTFYVARPGPNLIFGAYVPAQLYFPDRGVFQLSDGTIRAGVELEQGAVYTVGQGAGAVTLDGDPHRVLARRSCASRGRRRRGQLLVRHPQGLLRADRL